MAKENQLALLERFTQAIEEAGEVGNIQVHIMPDRIIAEVRKLIGQCTEKREEYRTNIPDMEMRLIRTRETTIPELEKEIKFRSGDKSISESKEEVRIGRMRSCGIDESSQLRVLEINLDHYESALREVNDLEEAIPRYKSEFNRLDALINQYEAMIMRILLVCVKD